MSIVSLWNKSNTDDKAFSKCPKLKQTNIVIDNKETATDNNKTIWISDSLENFQKLMQGLSKGSEADKVIIDILFVY